MKNLKLILKTYDYNARYKLLWCLPLFLSLIFFDWITKALIVKNFSYGQEGKLIPGFIKMEYIINPGAALGMNSDNPTLAIALAALVTIILIGIFVFVNNKFWTQSINVMLAGSFANLMGRAWAPNVRGISGGVVDFLKWDFQLLGSDTYIFNLADLFVNISIGMLILSLIIFSIQQVKEIFYKKNQQKYDFYLETKDKLHKLEKSYLHSIKKQTIKNRYELWKTYLKDKKVIKTNWKIRSKEINKES
ncbi:signal peptidase II [Spiroplasma apis]|uniref:Lipoprotein signal peptidase n=1 Tax=Spiroplasma apis B31 TaxID=1276258 RepID=V5RKF1_SPIAP|nr:signal peptidase II [Spiroplasma apis]AHB36576.1 lipoprotein signal peptidase [Spiroplasma apis B31]